MTSAKESPEAPPSQDDVEKTAPAAIEPSPSQILPQYPGWRKLSLIMTALYLAMFLVALVHPALKFPSSSPQN